MALIKEDDPELNNSHSTVRVALADTEVEGDMGEIRPKKKNVYMHYSPVCSLLWKYYFGYCLRICKVFISAQQI